MIFQVFVEGGGDTNKLRTECRKGFSEFFRKCQLGDRKSPKITACGSRNEAFSDFCTATKEVERLRLKGKQQKYVPILLVDSESAVSNKEQRWAHLKQRDNWDCPAGFDDESVFLMVECMESWFLADRECLAEYFGKYFNSSSLPGNNQIEQISKAQVFQALNSATRNCKPKGAYGKGKHSFEILALIAADKVLEVAEHAQFLVNRLKEDTSR